MGAPRGPPPQSAYPRGVGPEEVLALSATLKEKQGTWLTIDEADKFAKALGSAWAAVDAMSVRCYGLINPDDPWERPEDGGRPPTLADVGVLARVVAQLRAFVDVDAEAMRDEYLPKFDQILASASGFEAWERGLRS